MKRVLQVMLLAAVVMLARVPAAKALDCDVASGFADVCDCNSIEAECNYFGGGFYVDNCSGWYQGYSPEGGIFWANVCDAFCNNGTGGVCAYVE